MTSGLRFFVTDPRARECLKEVAPHIRAARLRVGEAFTLCDGYGREFLCVVTAINNSEVTYDITEERICENEPGYALTVFMAYSKSDRLEYAVQKCTELGASHFVLFPSRNTVAAPDAKSLPKKITRLHAIARAAAEQSGRGIIPEVESVSSFENAVERAAACELPVFAYECERETALRSVLPAEMPRSISVVTGAEGGFTEAEAALAARSGLTLVSLGKRILRCDTAPIAIAAAISTAYC